MKSDLSALRRKARKHGWTIELTRNNHYAWTPPGGLMPVVVSASTPSDYRGLLNMRAVLRRHGLPKDL